MRVLLAGATGNLGYRIVAGLAERGHEVRGLSRGPDGDRIVEDNGGEPVRGDLFDRDSLVEAASGADAVVRVATAIPTGTKPDEREWETNDRIRRNGTRNLIEAAVEAGADRYLQESVVWTARRPDGAAFDETAPANPDRTTRSAVGAERIAAEAGDEYDLDVATLRLGWLYAADAELTRFMARELLRRRLPIIGGGPLGRRDARLSCLHVRDAADAFVEAVEAEATGLYHVVDDEPVTTAAYLRTFAGALAAPAPLRVPGWLARYLAGEYLVRFFTIGMPTSNDCFREATDWEPAYPTYREGLAEVVGTWRADGTLVETDGGYAWAADE